MTENGDIKHPRLSRKRKFVASISFVLLIMLFVSLVANLYASPKASVQGDDDLTEAVTRSALGLTVALNVTVDYKNGTTCNFYDPDDPVTTPFRQLLIGIFQDVAGQVTTSFSMTDINGNNRSPYIRHSSTATHAPLYGGSGSIIFGSGATPATASDYKVQTATTVGFPVTGAIYSSATGNIVATSVGAIPFGVTTLSETGYYVYYWVNTLGSAAYFCLFHDTFAAIPVSAGNVVTIQYTLSLGNSGFTDNFGYILAEFMGWVPTSVTGVLPAFNTPLSLTDIFGNSFSTSVKTTTGANDTFSTVGLTTTVNNNGVSVGTSNTAISRSAYSLGANVSAITTHSLPTYGNALLTGNVTLASTIIMPGDQTLREAGYFMKIKSNQSNGAYYTIMLWRMTFNDYAYTANTPLTITFNIGE